jgi:hypothetical protein
LETSRETVVDGRLLGDDGEISRKILGNSKSNVTTDVNLTLNVTLKFEGSYFIKISTEF